ncbi:MAG TPA: methyltransferase domain-containing protein [Mycobacteriales bacterium]|nr:methyltransferase domain-containing protein [Mycobacteriales bacterium]
MSALDRWRLELEAWAIPDEILARAPEPPWGFPVELFRAGNESTDTPSRDVALDALPAGGTVLDVGCGGGAASLALVPPAGRVVGVDSTPGMLTEYAVEAATRGVAHDEVEGTWPDVAATAGTADVVVCHHVFYNVADLPPFVTALTAAAQRRVVVELTASHPLTAGAPLWRHFHGIDRPDGPTADLALEVLREIGVTPQSKAWSRPPRDVPREAYVRLNRRRLCLPVEAEPEVDRMMADPTTASRDVVTIWWDVT